MTDRPAHEKVAAAYQRLKQELDKIVSMAAIHTCATPIGNCIRVADPSCSTIQLAARRAIAILTALQEQHAMGDASTRKDEGIQGLIASEGISSPALTPADREEMLDAMCAKYEEVATCDIADREAMEAALSALEAHGLVSVSAPEIEALKHDAQRLQVTNAELLAENQALRYIEATKQAWRDAGFAVSGGHVPRGPYYAYSGPYRVQPHQTAYVIYGGSNELSEYVRKRKLVENDGQICWRYPDGSHRCFTPADVELINAALSLESVDVEKVRGAFALINNMRLIESFPDRIHNGYLLPALTQLRAALGLTTEEKP